MQEPVLLEPDVDERGLKTGQHVVHAALVDVADYRARTAALQIQLGDVVARTRAGVLTPPARPGVRLAGGNRAGRATPLHAGGGCGLGLAREDLGG